MKLFPYKSCFRFLTSLFRTVGVLVIAGLSFSSNSFAIPMGFVDRGSFTTNISQRLDWLDVTETVDQSYLEIAAKLSPTGSLGAAGWRFATDSELQILLSDYFDINFMGGPFSDSPLGPGQNLIVNEFISIFGDTLKAFLDISPDDITKNSLGLRPLETTSGYTNGYLLSAGGISATGRFVFDYEITRPGGSFFDQDDGINAYRTNANMRFSDLGAWLVRTTAIPEPGGLLLMLLAFCILARGALSKYILRLIPININCP